MYDTVHLKDITLYLKQFLYNF